MPDFHLCHIYFIGRFWLEFPTNLFHWSMTRVGLVGSGLPSALHWMEMHPVLAPLEVQLRSWWTFARHRSRENKHVTQLYWGVVRVVQHWLMQPTYSNSFILLFIQYSSICSVKYVLNISEHCITMKYFIVLLITHYCWFLTGLPGSRARRKGEADRLLLAALRAYGESEETTNIMHVYNCI